MVLKRNGTERFVCGNFLGFDRALLGQECGECENDEHGGWWIGWRGGTRGGVG